MSQDSEKLTTCLKSLTSLDLIQKKIALLKLGRLIPDKLSDELRKEFKLKDPMMRYLMHKKLREGMESFFGNWKDETLENMRRQFVEELMYTDVPNYGLEYYPAKRVDVAGEMGVASFYLCNAASLWVLLVMIFCLSIYHK